MINMPCTYARSSAHTVSDVQKSTCTSTKEAIEVGAVPSAHVKHVEKEQQRHQGELQAPCKMTRPHFSQLLQRKLGEKHFNKASR